MLYNRTVLSAVVLLTGMVLVAGNCKKAIPVQELSAARSEIALARAMNAEEYAPDEFAEARESLLGAHQGLADEKYDEAKQYAMDAESQARDARVKSGYKNVLADYKEVAQSKKAADVAAADQLARDEYTNALNLSKEGVAMTKDARAKEEALADLPEDTTPEERTMRQKEVLAGYSAAQAKFEESNAGFTRAKNSALAQRDDLLDSVAGVDAKIQKAEKYGAAEVQSDLLKQCSGEAAAARRNISAGNLRDGTRQLASSEKMADDLLAKTLPAYAEKKKAEADEVVKAASRDYEALAGAGGLTTDDAASMKAIEENLAAAREAVDASEKNYDSKNYEESINESQEAIRLASIMREQMSPIAKRMLTEEKPVVTTGASGVYTVQKGTPAESLWRIAGKKSTYNNPFHWVKIYEANKDKIENPNLIFPGQQLVVPGAKSKELQQPSSEDKMEKVETLESAPRENVQ